MVSKKIRRINIQLFAEPEEDEDDIIDLDSESEDDDLENDDPSFDLEQDEDSDEDDTTDDTDDEVGDDKKDDEEDESDEEDEDGLIDDGTDEEDEEDEEDEDIVPAPTPETQPTSEKPAELTDLELQLLKLAKQLGIKAETPQDALDNMAAEAENMTVEEYRQKRKEDVQLEKAKALVKQQEFAKVMAADLAELKKSIPSLAEVTDLRKIDNFSEFGRLRDKGLTPVQAYMAVNGDKLLNGKQAIAKQKAVIDSKAHLQSITPKNTSDSLPRIPKDEVAMWKDLFPDLSDKELRKVYAKSNK